VWTALWEAAGQDEGSLDKYLRDGLHLNAEGYTIVYELLVDTIQKEFPELHYDKLPMVFAHWTDINWQDPRPTLKSNRIEL